MARPALEVADILRDHGPAWREANRGHVSLDQLKVMSAIERCRTAALGGHVARCENEACGHTLIAYNSLPQPALPEVPGRGRHADGWPTAKPSSCRCRTFMSCYTLPSELRDIAYQNKRVIYDLLMKAAAETTLAIAADPKRLGARIGITAVLHTWGSALTHHPHVHMIVPGGGLSLDGSRWVSCTLQLPRAVKCWRACSGARCWRCSCDAHDAGQLKFFNTHAGLADKRRSSASSAAAAAGIEWVVYCKAPFAGPEAGAALSLPLHPSCRHLQPPPRCSRRRPASPSAGRTIAIDGPGR